MEHHEFLRYEGRLFCKACSQTRATVKQSIRRILWTISVPIVLALLIYFIPAIKPIFGEGGLIQEWIVALVGIALIVAFVAGVLTKNLILAPFATEREKETIHQQEIEKLKKDLRERENALKVLEEEKEPVLEIVEVKEANYQQMGQTHGLVITNKGTDRADDCRGQLIEIEFANPEEGLSLYCYPVNQPLTWAEQESTFGVNQPFTIHGKDSKVLNLIIYRYVGGRPVVEIAYSASQDLRSNNPITNFEDAYMIISVTSLNRLPIYAVCRYRRAADTYGYPRLTFEVTKDKPTISSYPRLDSHKGGSQP